MHRVRVVACAAPAAAVLCAIPGAHARPSWVYTDLHPQWPALARTTGQGGDGDAMVGYGFRPGPVRDGRAIVWRGGLGSTLEPAAGLYDSYAFNVWDNRAVGVGRELVSPFTYHDRAHVWDITTGTATNLHALMTGVDQSLGQDVWRNKVALYAFGPATGGAEHAFLYDGATFTDLHSTLPAGQYSRTYRVRVFGDFVTAWTEGAATAGGTHTILWDTSSGTPVARNLAHETDLSYAQAEDIYGSTVVGSGSGPVTGDSQHALAWTVGADGAITLRDLHPAGYFYSAAMAVRGNWVAGVAQPNDAFQAHAGVWNLLTGEFFDLHPPELGDDFPSAANAVDEHGTVWGATGNPLEWRAAEWRIVPAPGALFAMIAGAGLGAARRRRGPAHHS